MEKGHRDVLRKCTVYLVENLMVDALWPHLMEQGIFSSIMLEDILAAGPRHQQVQKLCMDLPRRGPKAFEKFMTCLEGSAQGDIAEFIRQKAQTMGVAVRTVPLQQPMDAMQAPPPLPPAALPPGGSRDDPNNDVPMSAAYQDTEPPGQNPYSLAGQSGDPRQDAQTPLVIQPMAPTAHLSQVTGRMANVPSTKQEPGSKDDEVDNQSAAPMDTTDQTGNFYQMKANPRGYVLVINNETFNNKEPRKGARMDSLNLHALFEGKLGWKVEEKNNISAQAMKTLVWDFAKHEVHRNHDCAGLVLLSHGMDGNRIIGSDNDAIDIDELLSAFNRENAEHLANKPKLVLIQACRGVLIQKGRGNASGITARGDATKVHASGNEVEAASDALPSEPPRKLNERDMFIAFATMPGYKAWRDTNDGSWFVQDVSKVLEQCAQHEHVSELFARVRRTMAESYGDLMDQVPPATDTLSRSWYLNPIR